jgi:hypothetical protein
MGILDDIFNVLQKPQGMVTGAFAGLGNTIGRAVNPGAQEDEVELTKIFDHLDKVGIDTSQYEHMRPRAQTIWSGIQEGWDNKVGPSRILEQARPTETWETPQSGFQRALGTAGNVVMDPLAVAGATGAVGKLASASGLARKVPAIGQISEGAAIFGKLPKGTPLATRAGTYGRRGIQGTLATGNPITGAAAGSLIGLGEKGAQRLALTAAGRLASLPRAIENSRYRRAASGTDPDTGQLFPDGLGRAAVEDAGAATPDLISKAADYDVPLGRSAEGLYGNQQLALPRGSSSTEMIPPWAKSPEINPIPMGRTTDSTLVEGLKGLPLPASGQRSDMFARGITETGRNQGKFVNKRQRELLGMLQNDPDTLGRIFRQLEPSRMTSDALLEQLRRIAREG